MLFSGMAAPPSALQEDLMRADHQLQAAQRLGGDRSYAGSNGLGSPVRAGDSSIRMLHDDSIIGSNMWSPDGKGQYDSPAVMYRKETTIEAMGYGGLSNEAMGYGGLGKDRWKLGQVGDMNNAFGAPEARDISDASPQNSPYGASYGDSPGVDPRFGSPPPTRIARPMSAQTNGQWCCRIGHDFSSTAPPVDPRELFVNVTVRRIEELSPVKTVHSWIGGVMGTVMGAGKNHFSYKISESHFKENELGIKAELMKCFLNRGWDVNVTTMLLPPMRGNQNPSTHVQLTRDALPVFMVFRVELGRKHWRFGSFCSDQLESLPFHRPIHKKENEKIGMELRQALHMQQKVTSRQIHSEISVADAADEMHVLYNMHWSEEQAATCIMRSRWQAVQNAGSITGSPILQYAGSV